MHRAQMCSIYLKLKNITPGTGEDIPSETIEQMNETLG